MLLRSARLVRTKLTPPRANRFTLQRPDLVAKLKEAAFHRLTILQAGTGYGKSTSLSLLAREEIHAVWYHLSEEDSDAYIFLSHVLVGLEEKLGKFSPALPALIEEWEQNRALTKGPTLVDTLVNEIAEKINAPLYLVIDDAHLMNLSKETCVLFNRFVNHAPSQLHIICATRHPLNLPDLVMWRMYGELYEIDQSELAFTSEEIGTLFVEQFGYSLSQSDIRSLHSDIEGWPIALPLIWQTLKRSNQPNGHNGRLNGHALSIKSGDLLTYLTREVMSQQSERVQQFLKETGVLREFTPAICNRLTQRKNSQKIIDYLQEQGLFIVPIDTEKGRYRYHHLFREVLMQMVSAEERHAYHLAAATLWEAEASQERAIYHYLKGDQQEAAVKLIANIGNQLVNEGRLQTLSDWIDQIPDRLRDRYPQIHVYQGHIERLHSRFDLALDYYQRATTLYQQQAHPDLIGWRYALCSQARIYLDTVNPSEADALLQEAVDLFPPEEDETGGDIQVYQLMAENQLNLGDYQKANQYQALATRINPDREDFELRIRLLFRTGRLKESERLIQLQLQKETDDPIRKPRAHRETHLIQALLQTFIGNQALAMTHANLGIKRGDALDSQYITAVGYARLGKAHLLTKDLEGYLAAESYFQQALELSEVLMVPRIRLIALWGLCQVEGFRGDLHAAREIAQEAATLARETGDRWVRAGINLQLGASYVLHQSYDEALGWLNQAHNIFKECGDRFGEANAHLWRSLIWHQTGSIDRLNQEFAASLRHIKENEYGFIFQQKTFYGPPDPRSLVPLLIHARQSDDPQLAQYAPFALRQLKTLNLESIATHPGFQLKVNMLGQFRVFRGEAEEILASDWKRQKAKQLFMLLVTSRASLMEREQIIDTLWPDIDLDGGQRDFKIAYTTLCKVLEPSRARKSPSTYVLRDGTRYGLRVDADIEIDAVVFDQYVTKGDRLYGINRDKALDAYTMGLERYGGEYMQEYPYEAWAEEERNRLQISYLRTAERVGEIETGRNNWGRVIEIGETILRLDSCRETAYRMLMLAHDKIGKRAQAVRIYQRCAETLDHELGITPSPETERLFKQINQ